ncbi:MAG: universal stress protein [Desulfobacterales bacterium]|nr:universal stress protein [Desulfobacterales bacterium]
MISIQTIMTHFDLSKTSIRAAQVAASLAHAYNARLYLLHVREPYPRHGRIAGGFFEAVQQKTGGEPSVKLQDVIPQNIRKELTLEKIEIVGSPVHKVIIEKVKELSVDVIVIAADESRGLIDGLKKGLAEHVIQQVPCNVFVVKSQKMPSSS